jgi:hypothetical protein
MMRVGHDLCVGFFCFYFSGDCVIHYRSVGFAVPPGRRPPWQPRTIREARIYFSDIWEEMLSKLYIEKSFCEDYGLVMCYVMWFG